MRIQFDLMNPGERGLPTGTYTAPLEVGAYLLIPDLSGTRFVPHSFRTYRDWSLRELSPGRYQYVPVSASCVDMSQLRKLADIVIQTYTETEFHYELSRKMLQPPKDVRCIRYERTEAVRIPLRSKRFRHYVSYWSGRIVDGKIAYIDAHQAIRQYRL